ncbi:MULTISPECIES: hypothetical protein [Pseudoalteromonas]|uniref:hypothetical protein n=1 Tax=Pseudoalteromonas TaxID=53246 RepID=UPI000F7ABC44|nr:MULTISPECIES: hypothetical protein [Pseudoalteromonas]MCG7564583.1 DUF3997 domain-containing protein [Pseudoalteromonas sp. McH1-42]MEC4091087.1 hypothetical protein [Pseudoalteromonas rubra]
MKIVSLILMILLLAGCDSAVLWEDKPYQVLWLDDTSNRTLSYDFGDGGFITRIDAQIVAVGSNNRFIVAKRTLPNTDILVFYYIEKSSDSQFAEGAAGPFTEAQFQQLKQKLDLPEFTKTFE